MAAGLPMINSLGYDLKNLIDLHSLGYNYAAGNHIELFDRIERLEKDRELLGQMKKNCLELSETFHETTLYGEYVQFCKNVIEQISPRQSNN